jgi:hypothetical protein
VALAGGAVVSVGSAGVAGADRLTLLGALCWRRQSEITDALVDLLIGLVHKVNATAERRVERTLTDDLKRVRGKQGILFRLAAAAVDQPDETVRRALFPVVGEGTLRDLIREAEANERAFRAQVRTVLRGSYSGHYRRMLGPLLAALEFRSNNAAYRPVIDAVDLLARYAHVDGKRRFYGPEARVPIAGVVPAAWRDAVVDDQGRSTGSRMSCACWSRCVTRSAGARSTSRGRHAGATPRTTCPLISRPAATCTTPRCASPWTRGSSSLPCSSG